LFEWKDPLAAMARPYPGLAASFPAFYNLGKSCSGDPRGVPRDRRFPIQGPYLGETI
jgi:hypothetical protein